MAKEITALEFRKHFGEIMDEVCYRKEPYIVKRNGRPVVALVDIEAYQTSEAQRREGAFIEEYTQERLDEFLREDRLERSTRERVRRLLK